jgi:hypothetical protein
MKALITATYGTAMLWERIFTWRLRQEIDHWEATGLLEAEALRQLREHYGFQTSDRTEEDATGRWTRWILYLAIITFLAAFFSFASSHAVDLGPTIRVGLLTFGAVATILTGFVIHTRHRISSMVLLVLGGMLLPISFFFAVHYYSIWPLHEPFLWWSVLGLTMAIGFGPLAQQWQEVALATSALLSALSVSFLYAFHIEADPLVYPTIAAALALALQLWRTHMPASWQPVWRFPLWSLGYVLAVGACVLPVVVHLYGTMWAAGIYFLAALYFVFEARTLQSTPTIASFVIALLAGIGALLRVGEVGLVYDPLVWLAVIVILLGVSLSFLRGRVRAMTALLDTLQVLVWISSIGFWLLPAGDFQAFSWRIVTIAGYGVLGVGLYGMALRDGMEPWRLAYLAVWHLMAGWRLFWLGNDRLMTFELYSLPAGGLLMLNAAVFADPRWREQAVGTGVAMLALPSMMLSLSDGHAVRTVLLALGGIGLVGMGALWRNRRYLWMGAAVLVPAVVIKLAPDLADLGLPRFVWFGIFGTLLVGIAWLLQRSHLR